LGSKIPSREEAFELLKKYNQSDSLIKHALTVEAVMEHFAEKLGEDKTKWGIIGLTHDIDYEMYPDEHCKKVVEILTGENWPEEYTRAIVSHGFGLCADVEPLHVMEKVLYTTDELTGLITATALLRPSKSVMDLEVKSIKKKWNTKAFAAGVDRSVIEDGAIRLGMPLEEIIHETILGMRKAADKIGLKGVVPSES